MRTNAAQPREERRGSTSSGCASDSSAAQGTAQAPRRWRASGGDRLLDVARRDGGERGEAAAGDVDGPGGVGVEADLERQRQALAHLAERGELAGEAGLVAGAQLDLERR